MRFNQIKMIEAHTASERRYWKCGQNNAAVANAIDTNPESKCAGLELNFLTSKPTKKKPKGIKENAARYKNMNRPKVIHTVCVNNPLITNINEFLDVSELHKSAYHANFSGEEWGACCNKRSVQPLRSKTP